MSAAIAHRGPDGCGIWEAPSGRAVLAHRRLAIIDLQTGQQPMLSPAGDAGVSFNGEIYNYIEIRDALLAAGQTFSSASDTEVLLRSYAVYGDACVDHFRGMFAFAIWDDSRQRLLLARDRLGKKPLFYTIEDGSLYFASTLAALRTSAPHPAALSDEAIYAYLSLGYVPAPLTAYRGYSKLEAASLLTIDCDGRRSTTRYWSSSRVSGHFAGSFSDAVEASEAVIGEAVRLRLRSDVPLGVFLSGGIDSSLIAALAARQNSHPVSTFAVGFDVREADEALHASDVARHLGTDHRSIQASPDLLAMLPSLIEQFGEPFADSASLPLAALAQATRKHVTVALSGDGGDEAFGGYDWYRSAARLRRMTRLIGWTGFLSVARGGMAGINRLLGGLPTLDRATRALLALSARDAAVQYASLRVLFGPSELGALMEAGEAVRSAPIEYLANAYRATSGDSLRQMRATDIATLLPESLMPKVDVATMAHALEARAPLLDHVVVEFGLSLPEKFLVDGSGGKRVLRTLLKRYLPNEMVERPKHGFTVPLDQWFGGARNPHLERLERSEALAAVPGIRMEGVTAITREHAEGRRRHGERLYALFALDEWMRHQ